MSVDALTKLKSTDTKIFNALIRVLADPIPEVREAAMMAFGELKDARAIEFLKIVVPDKSRGMWSRNIGDSAVSALLQIGTPEALEVVEAWRNDPEPFRKRFQDWVNGVSQDGSS